MSTVQPEVKPKSEKDKLKEKYPALCKPDDSVWMVGFHFITLSAERMSGDQAIILSFSCKLLYLVVNV